MVFRTFKFETLSLALDILLSRAPDASLAPAFRPYIFLQALSLPRDVGYDFSPFANLARTEAIFSIRSWGWAGGRLAGPAANDGGTEGQPSCRQRAEQPCLDTASQIREGAEPRAMRQRNTGGADPGVPEAGSSQGTADEQLHPLHLSAAFPDRACPVFTESCTSSKRHVA